MPAEADRVGMFLAGCVTEDDRGLLAKLSAEVWSTARIAVGSDRDSGLAAALGKADGIAVNAGTGASVTGRRGERIEKAGGWGHLLGDAGGGYFLSLQALRFILREYDLHRGEAQFTASILRALALNSRDDLVRWAQTADKLEVASLAPVVFEAATNGDEHVMKIVEDGAGVLSEYTAAVATRLGLLAPKVILLGGLFQRDGVYVHAFKRKLKKNLSDARVSMSEQSPELGAAWLAAEMEEKPAFSVETRGAEVENLARALTEQRNPRSEKLEELSAQELVELFVEEEKFVQEALRKETAALARAIEMAAKALRKGGRVIYVGAGTSGRLGVLDASEIPPTFGADPDLVQGIIAGGLPALTRSQEGAEDVVENGAKEIDARDVGPNDFVLGIAASGTTPYVRAALVRARERGAKTGILSCSRISPEFTREVDVVILPITGPEVVTGSTRMKAGTATKLVLNTITTGAMIRLGKTFGNLMVDLRATNDKLRDRSERIVVEVCGVDRAGAREILGAAGGSVKLGIVMHKLGATREDAERALEKAGGAIRKVIPGPPPPVT